MSGALINVSIEDRQVKDAFSRIAAKVHDMTPFMQIVGETIRTSVVRNFEAGGRPDRWPVSKRVMKKGGKTLIEKGRLVNSINVHAHPGSVEVGTNAVYAAAQQFGVDQSTMGRVKSHMRKVSSRDIKFGRKTIAKGVAAVKDHERMHRMLIPPRPFLMIQDEDWPVIKAHAEDYLLKNSGG